MTTKKIIALTILTNTFLLFLLLAILLVVGPASARTATKPLTGVTTSCGLVSASEFNAWKQGLKYRNNGHFLRVLEESNLNRFIARIFLPDGETIATFRLGAIDDSARKIVARLFRQDLSDGSRDSIATVESTGSDPALRTFETSAISNPVVDNDLFTYYVQVEFTGKGETLKFIYAEVDCLIVP